MATIPYHQREKGPFGSFKLRRRLCANASDRRAWNKQVRKFICMAAQCCTLDGYDIPYHTWYQIESWDSQSVQKYTCVKTSLELYCDWKFDLSWICVTELEREKCDCILNLCNRIRERDRNTHRKTWKCDCILNLCNRIKQRERQKHSPKDIWSRGFLQSCFHCSFVKVAKRKTVGNVFCFGSFARFGTCHFCSVKQLVHFLKIFFLKWN